MAKKKVVKKKKVAKVVEPTILKLDLGCGRHPKEGFEGVDIRDFGQKHKLDLTKPWPWENDSVDEVHCSHFVEHLDGPERIHFANELYRVLKPGSAATIITPHWNSCRAYGDMTHKWPPVCEFWFYYLSKVWREANAPHNDGYNCDFECTWAYTLHESLATRNQEYQMFAVNNYKEAAQDMIGTLKKPAKS